MTAIDAHPRAAKFVAKYPYGFRGTLLELKPVILEWLPQRFNAMDRALVELQQYFGTVIWSDTWFALRSTHGRAGSPIRCGANQTVTGHTLHGVEVVYRYHQGVCSGGGDRQFGYNGRKWTSISLLTDNSAKELMATVV